MRRLSSTNTALGGSTTLRVGGRIAVHRVVVVAQACRLVRIDRQSSSAHPVLRQSPVSVTRARNSWEASSTNRRCNASAVASGRIACRDNFATTTAIASIPTNSATARARTQLLPGGLRRYEVPTLADVDWAREVSGRWVRCGERRIVGAASYRKQHHRQRKPCHAAPHRGSSSSSYSPRVWVGRHGAIVAEPADDTR